MLSFAFFLLMLWPLFPFSFCVNYLLIPSSHISAYFLMSFSVSLSIILVTAWFFYVSLIWLSFCIFCPFSQLLFKLAISIRILLFLPPSPYLIDLLIVPLHALFFFAPVIFIYWLYYVLPLPMLVVSFTRSVYFTFPLHTLYRSCRLVSIMPSWCLVSIELIVFLLF